MTHKMTLEEAEKRAEEQKNEIQNFMSCYCSEYETATELAEAVSNNFEIYANDGFATIPECIFEWAAYWYD